MSNKTQLQTNNEKYTSLIEILRTKAIPSGGEDVTEETNSYTEKITSLENAVNALETEIENKTGGGSSGTPTNTFPYSITFTQSGVLEGSPIICYGNDNDTVTIITRANTAGACTSEWSYENCKLVLHNVDTFEFGDYAFFNNFTGNALINITWTAPSDGGYE